MAKNTKTPNLKYYLVIGFLFLAISCVEKKEENKSKKEISKELIITDSISKARIQIFGSHPYWLENAHENYQLDLITTASFYAYNLNPTTGFYEPNSDWKPTGFFNSVKRNNSKTYLTVTNYGLSNNNVFLGNKLAQDNSINNLEKHLNELNIDGVIVDFEDIPVNKKNAFSNYIIKLSQRLKLNQKYLAITIPGNKDLLSSSNSYDFEMLQPYVSYFIISSLNFTVASSQYAEPALPLLNNDLWNNISVESILEFYSNKKIPSGKIILTIPYFGSKWEVTNHTLPSHRISFIENMTYSKIIDLNLEPKYDVHSHTAYINFTENGQKFQIWYDDEKTLNSKYDFILKQGLGGVHIWALGYDNGYEDLWDVINKKFWIQMPVNNSD